MEPGISAETTWPLWIKHKKKLTDAYFSTLPDTWGGGAIKPSFIGVWGLCTHYQVSRQLRISQHPQRWNLKVSAVAQMEKRTVGNRRRQPLLSIAQSRILWLTSTKVLQVSRTNTKSILIPTFSCSRSALLPRACADVSTRTVKNKKHSLIRVLPFFSNLSILCFSFRRKVGCKTRLLAHILSQYVLYLISQPWMGALSLSVLPTLSY